MTRADRSRATGYDQIATVSTILPSRIRYGVAAARARSRASCKSGAQAAGTSMTSSRYRYAVDCGSPNPAPSRRLSPLSRNRPGRTVPAVAAQPAGSLPGLDLAAAGGRQILKRTKSVPWARRA